MSAIEFRSVDQDLSRSARDRFPLVHGRRGRAHRTFRTVRLRGLAEIHGDSGVAKTRDASANDAPSWGIHSAEIDL